MGWLKGHAPDVLQCVGLAFAVAWSWSVWGRSGAFAAAAVACLLIGFALAQPVDEVQVRAQPWEFGDAEGVQQAPPAPRRHWWRRRRAPEPEPHIAPRSEEEHSWIS